MPAASMLTRVAAGSAALAATFVVRKLLASGWRKATDREPPDPAHPRTNFGEAIVWTAVSAAALAATQLLVTRGIASEP